MVSNKTTAQSKANSVKSLCKTITLYVSNCFESAIYQVGPRTSQAIDPVSGHTSVEER